MYKRQGQFCKALDCLNVPYALELKVMDSDDRLHITEEITLMELILKFQGVWDVQTIQRFTERVSYTHLDVYKRQVYTDP